MRNFLIRIILNATAIGITAYLLQGRIVIVNNDLISYLILGLIFGLVNSIIKPIVTLLTCPFVILSLGLFILVINGAMLMLTARLSGGTLQVESLGWAIIGGIIISIINMILEALLDLDENRGARAAA